MATKSNDVTPAPAEPKVPTRKDVLATFASKTYAGPTSFTVTVLRGVVEWMESGAPKDAKGVPVSVLHSVNPELKPASKAKVPRLTKVQQGYQQALAEVESLKDLASVKKWVADNRVEVVA